MTRFTNEIIETGQFIAKTSTDQRLGSTSRLALSLHTTCITALKEKAFVHILVQK